MSIEGALTTYVIRPEVPFLGIHSLLIADEWTGGPVTLTAPLVRDEPEVARYRREGESATYELDPVAWLRLWRSSSGPPKGLPLLGEKEILALLDLPASTDLYVQRLLLAVSAAGELGLTKAVPGLLRVRQRSGSPIVAGAASSSLRLIARSQESRRQR